LAEATWSDSWKLDAITLQVQWRCHKTDNSGQIGRQWGEEALNLTDEAIAAQPAILLYALRVQSALAARRPDAVIESIWAYGHGLFLNHHDAAEAADRAAPHADVTSPQASEARSYAIAALQELMHLLDQQTGADPARVAEVRAGLLNDLRELLR